MADEWMCCGERVQAWRGGPPRAGCALCPRSPTYWRRAQNRPDGRDYRPATAAESYAAVTDDGEVSR